MAKEWLLNSVMNRFQYNFKRNVGAVSEEIRKCTPKNIEEWEKYYFKNVRTQEHIKELGEKLYTKITEEVPAEVEMITVEDCINYMYNLVINRTYDGYTTEIKTISELLRKIISVNIEPAPDEWDRLYNVDFYIKINGKYIGLQIKPVSGVSHIPQINKEHSIQLDTHQKFTSKYGGKVFYIFSLKQGNKKIIHNVDVIDDIKKEIKRLEQN